MFDKRLIRCIRCFFSLIYYHLFVNFLFYARTAATKSYSFVCSGYRRLVVCAVCSAFRFGAYATGDLSGGSVLATGDLSCGSVLATGDLSYGSVLATGDQGKQFVIISEMVFPIEWHLCRCCLYHFDLIFNFHFLVKHFQ